MKIEKRWKSDDKRKRVPRGLVLIAESEEESDALDWAFGKGVGYDGLIGTSTVECKLADGYGEHYIYIPVVERS